MLKEGPCVTWTTIQLQWVVRQQLSPTKHYDYEMRVTSLSSFVKLTVNGLNIELFRKFIKII